MPLKFSLTRLLIAIGIFAIPLALFSSYGDVGTIVAVIVSSCLLLIALSVQVSHIRPIARILLAAFLGILLGLMIMPGKPGDDFRYSIGGLIFGCFCGLFWNAIISTKNESPDTMRIGLAALAVLGIIWLLFPISEGTMGTLVGFSGGPDPNTYTTTYAFGRPLPWLKWQHSWNQARGTESYGMNSINIINLVVHTVVIVLPAFLFFRTPWKKSQRSTDT
jgi:hypothetical protein